MRLPSLRNLVVASVIALSCALSAPSAHAQSGGERIRAMHADITVQEDGIIRVRERIDYFFDTERHGIYRDLPLRYQAEGGPVIEKPISGVEVTDGAGAAIPFEVQRNRVSLRVKIGDPDRTISGAHTYVISYTVSGALGYFADHDELYWNATGNSWTVPIESATATVRLPDSISADDVTFTCYTGAVGSTAKDCLVNKQGNSVAFAASGPLTIVVGWPPGLVAKLEAREIPPVEPHLVLPFLLPLAAFVGLYWYWRKRGRDPFKERALVVQYDPPPGLRPAEIGTLMDEKADVSDLSCTVVDLAVRGYLAIRETEKGKFVWKTKDYELGLLKADYAADPALKPYEKALLDALFADGTVNICVMSELKSKHTLNAKLAEISRETYKGLVADGMFDLNPNTVRGIFIGMGVVVGFVGFVVTGAVASNDALTGVATGAAFALTALLFVVFAFAMPRKTEKGALAFQHARGFREYIAKAEKYRLQWQERENMFEVFLPYAMAFGVVDKWTKALAGMGIVPSQPGWYVGSPGAWNMAAFASSMQGVDSAVKGAMMSAPQSSGGGSGFGGGGSSGGGGGGGGGGSW